MKFQSVAIIDQMITFYEQPREVQTRFFDGYLKLIQTSDKRDIQRPLPFFNPMAKEHILHKLKAMKTMRFEGVFEQVCRDVSSTDGKILQTYWNLADDVEGLWTVKEEVQETSKKIRPFITRGFCVVVFFASEDITIELIKNRVEEYAQLYLSYS